MRSDLVDPVGIIGAVLRPVNLAAKFILEYDASGRILEADEAAQDEMGGLVRKVRNTIVRLDLAKKEVDQASKIEPDQDNNLDNAQNIDFQNDSNSSSSNDSHGHLQEEVEKAKSFDFDNLPEHACQYCGIHY